MNVCGLARTTLRPSMRPTANQGLRFRAGHAESCSFRQPVDGEETQVMRRPFVFADQDFPDPQPARIR